MRQMSELMVVQTRNRGLTDVTRHASSFLKGGGAIAGLLTLWCRHTSASLLVQENADPDVRADLESFFARIAPEGRGLYVHGAEGPDDMPAHIRAALTQTQLSIPVNDGAMVLGTWQGIYLYEHRTRPHRREVAMHFIGE